MAKQVITKEELDLLFPDKMAQGIAIRILGLYLEPPRITIDVTNDLPVIIKRFGKVVYED